MAERFPYDRSSKWLIQHHGNSLLWFGGLQQPFTWNPVQPEVVQPRQLPDGLLEVRRPNQREPDRFIVEITTYPDARVVEQVLRDATLVYAAYDVLPEVLILVLHPKGNLRVESTATLSSRLGWSRWQGQWRVVELWTLPAEQLLSANDIGLVPWAPLCNHEGPAEALLQHCRERIDKLAPPQEHDNLLAVTQVLARLRYNDLDLATIFGGKKNMIESPLIKELLAENTQEVKQGCILRTLTRRFEPVPEEVAARIRSIHEQEWLDKLLDLSYDCLDLQVFRQALQL